LAYLFVARNEAISVGTALCFSFNPLKINYSIRRKNNVLFWGRTKSMTEKITEGLASGAK